MRFEWDAKKSSANQKKHALYPIEDQRITIGKHQNKVWTAIYTMRGNAIRIISLRRARRKEAELYGKEKAGEKQCRL